MLMLSVSATAGSISISQAVDKSTVAYEDSVQFEIRLQWQGPQSAYLFDKPLSPTILGLKVRGFSSSIASAGTGPEEITTKTYRYTLIPGSPGVGRIQPVSIEYLITEEMTVNVAEPLPVPVSGGFPIWLVIVIVVVVAAGAGAFIWHRSRNREVVEPVKSPKETLLEDLASLKQDAGTDLKNFQTGLCRILPAYLQAVYRFDPNDLEREALTERLIAGGLVPDKAEKVAGWLSRARIDKFRPVSASPGETIRLESEIRNMFESM